jgi:hypothetical protein
MLQLLPYALAAYGGFKDTEGAREAGVGGLGSLVQGALGAYGGYNLGQLGGFAEAAGFGSTVPTFTNMPGISSIPGISRFQNPTALNYKGSTYDEAGVPINPGMKTPINSQKGGSILDLVRKEPGGDYDPMKVAIAAGGIPFLAGAFDQAPTDVYTPGYNTNYLKTREERSFSYIDPTTGEEKEYKKVYVPEQNPNDPGMMMNTTRLRTGGLAQIKKFNEGGINYLPSKMTHDENDSNNYVRASGYVEDGAGVGDKDEDTMLAQLADGEFVTRADGVLGAGIIAGANPNSMKDMREKGAAYFYEQQKRYKRVFDLLKEANGNSKQKTN